MSLLGHALSGYEDAKDGTSSNLMEEYSVFLIKSEEVSYTYISRV